MTQTKVEILTQRSDQHSSTNETDSQRLSTASNRQNLQADLRKNKSADSVEIVPGETVLDPQTLKTMYLLGKLTQGQLAHEMKKYNDVVADSQIKFGKKDHTQSIDYKDVGRASVSNPGGDLKTDQGNNNLTRSTPTDAKAAKREAGNTDNDKIKKELQRQEQKLKAEENQVVNRRLNQFTETQAEQKKQHTSREQKNREEREELAAILDNPLDTQLDKASKTATRGAQRITKNLAAEIKAELDKAKGGPAQGSK
jgi:hypothetical protein